MTPDRGDKFDQSNVISGEIFLSTVSYFFVVCKLMTSLTVKGKL